MQLEDWLDDLCVRFIINLPPEELESVERICFQVEEAQWFYEDFIRPLDPSLPSLSLRAFSLRIFQHCPLFSQWSAQHHTTAFAEFLAYKSRVPVRGAIMLNESMDEVVLVKGWKKGANWSFPRGKINKDENDLDCAVREVYEETGFDIRAAGLVKDEKEMKYIEVTMREQHMRLYVFRGVPKDAQFEPKTRKEISKIEWYKLTDLPTLKKSRQHEGSGTDQPAVNANKFYMVAPFLNPLKKWIAQQRKKENRYSSHLAAPPMVPEELTTEDDQDINGVGARLAETMPQALSDLPEVSAPTVVDPTLHLKEILNIGPWQQPQPDAAQQPSHMAHVDTGKSNALLALLRTGPQRPAPTVPRTPLEQISLPPEVQQSPHVSHVRAPQVDQTQPPPQFEARPQNQSRSPLQPVEQRVTLPPTRTVLPSYPGQLAPQIAPYQRTGDPTFAQQGLSQQQHPVVPPASALPKLTTHTKALLDVFKSTTNLASPSNAPANNALPSLLTRAESSHRPELQRQNLPADVQASPNRTTPALLKGMPPSMPGTAHRSPSSENLHNKTPSLASARRPSGAQQTSLLALFNQPSKPKAMETPFPPAPAELCATAAVGSTQKPRTKKDDLLLALLRQGGQEATRKATEVKRPSPREGETSATISGPLNQPEFEVISRTTKHTLNEMGRSPLTSNRTLYNPNQPTPVKILTRPDESRQPAPRSPQSVKAPSKRSVKEKTTPKEASKPFQPQILRRPQTVEPPEPAVGPSAAEVLNQHAFVANATLSPSPISIEEREKLILSRKQSQSEAQKQTLLSLFGGGLDTTPKATVAQPGSGIVSPLSASQIMNSNGEVPLPGVEPISTRTSRVGSMASIASGPGPARGASEKRQTGAENKAFLLGYLGRIASQDS